MKKNMFSPAVFFLLLTTYIQSCIDKQFFSVDFYCMRTNDYAIFYIGVRLDGTMERLFYWKVFKICDIFCMQVLHLYTKCMSQS